MFSKVAGVLADEPKSDSEVHARLAREWEPALHLDFGVLLSEMYLYNACLRPGFLSAVLLQHARKYRL